MKYLIGILTVASLLLTLTLYAEFGDPLDLSPSPIIAAPSAPAGDFSLTSLLLDGSDEYVGLGNDTSLQITADISMTGWVKTTTSGSAVCFFAKSNIGSNRAIEFHFGSAGNLQILIANDGSATTNKNYASSITVNDGDWHMVGWTFTAAGVLKVYVDGAEDTSVTKTNDDAMTSIFNTTAPLQLGACQNSGSPSNFYDGNIDDMAIWSVVLDSTDISNVYNSGKPADLTAHADAANLEGYWKFDGDDNTNIVDHSTNTNTGTPNNIENADFVSDTP